MFRSSILSLCSRSPTFKPTSLVTFTAAASRTHIRRSSTMESVIKGVQTTVSQNLGGVAQKLAPADQQFSLEKVPDQTGKVAVVTGGSEGIGFGSSHTLLSKVGYFQSVSQSHADTQCRTFSSSSSSVCRKR